MVASSCSKFDFPTPSTMPVLAHHLEQATNMAEKYPSPSS